MAQDLTTLYNLALSSAGVHNFVSLPTERSPEAEICALWYPHVRDVVYRAAFWPDCKRSTYLAVQAERTDGAAWTEADPQPGWTYSYQYPKDCLRPRYLSTFEKFELGGLDDGSQVVYTGTPQAILIYTKSVTNLAALNSDLFAALTYALASAIAMPLHSKRNFAHDAEVKANNIIREARANDSNAQELHFDTVPGWIAARGYGGAPGQTRYMYPYGALVSTLGGADVN